LTKPNALALVLLHLRSGRFLDPPPIAKKAAVLPATELQFVAHRFINKITKNKKAQTIDSLGFNCERLN